MSARCIGASVTGSLSEARRSIPALSGVLYRGSSFPDLFTTFTVMSFPFIIAHKSIYCAKVAIIPKLFTIFAQFL